MVNEKLAERLTEVLATETVDLLRRATSEATAGGWDLTLFDLVEHCVRDTTVANLIGPKRVALACARLVEARPSRGRGGSAGPLSAHRILSEFCDVSATYLQSLGSGKASPLGVIVGLLVSSEDRLSGELMSIKRVLKMAGFSAEELIEMTTRPQAASNETYVYEPLGYGVNLTAAVHGSHDARCPVVGMEEPIERALRRLAYHSVCLIGEPGVGKSAFASGVAWHLARRSAFVRKKMYDWTIVSFSRTDLLAGTGVQGVLEERIKAFLDHLAATPAVIPFLDEVHTLLNARDEVGLKVVNLLKPQMAEGRFRCIAATTDREYERFIMPDEPLHSRFAPTIVIPEPSPQQTVQILTDMVDRIKPDDAEEHGVEIESEAIDQIVALTGRRQRHDRQPRKSLRLLREVFEQKCHACELESAGAERRINGAYVRKVAGASFGLNVKEDQPDYWREVFERMVTLFPGDRDALQEIVALFYNRGIGQGRSLDDPSPKARLLIRTSDQNAIRRFCRVLSSELRLEDGALHVEDMGRLSSESSRNLLVGAPPGYIGHDQTKTLFSKVRSRPQGGVLWLNRIELPHESLLPDLEALMTGMARDSSSNSVDLTEWVVVASYENVSDMIDSLVPNFDLSLALSGNAPDAREDSIEALLEKWRASQTSYPEELDNPAVQECIGTTAREKGVTIESELRRWFQQIAVEKLFDPEREH